MLLSIITKTSGTTIHANGQLILDRTHVDGLVTEVLDVLWAHVERWLTGHDKCCRKYTDKQTDELKKDKNNVHFTVYPVVVSVHL